MEDEARVHRWMDNVWAKRALFTFDYHADSLIEFFHQVIQKKKEKSFRS